MSWAWVLDPETLFLGPVTQSIVYRDFIFTEASYITLTQLTLPSLWSLTYFFVIFYMISVFSVGTYLIPQLLLLSNSTHFKNQISYTHITSWSAFKFFSTPMLLIILLNITWVSPCVSAWFGHISFTSFQYSTTCLVTLSFLLVWYVYSTTFVFNSKEIYDYMIVLYHAFLWLIALFYSNNVFTVVFFLEIISALTTLVLVTSLFSSAYFYNVNSATASLYFAQITPHTFLNTLIFFFWVSLVSSLLLFVFLILFYTQFLTFDFLLCESVFSYIVAVSNFKQVLTNILIIFTVVLVTFFKCGVVPLYIWKPVFFKGMSLHVIFYYICFFYFFLLLFFVYFLVIYFNDFTYYNRILLTTISLIGALTLFTVLIEAFYLKAFLAMSSILNTLLIFLALSSVSTSSFFIIM